MATGTGTQVSFYDALLGLIDMNRDAASAYDAAASRFGRKDYREKMIEFRDDHLAHITVLKGLLRGLKERDGRGKKTDHRSDGRVLITQNRGAIARLMGDRAMLHAMRSNELDSNTVYNRLVHRCDAPEDVRTYLEKAYRQENKHLIWLEEALDEGRGRRLSAAVRLKPSRSVGPKVAPLSSQG